MAAWRADRAEDVLARYVAQPELGRAIAQSAGEWSVNTDDRNLLEFAVARALGRRRHFRIEALLDLAEQRGVDRPALAASETSANIDWGRVHDAYSHIGMVSTATPRPLAPRDDDGDRELRFQAALAWTKHNPVAALRAWSAQPKTPSSAVELMVVADSYAMTGNELEALPLIEQLREVQPTEASAITARLHWSQDQAGPALAALRETLEAYRTDPWPSNLLLSRLMPLGLTLARADRRLVPTLVELLEPQLAVMALRYQREQLRFRIALLAADPGLCVQALDPLEPHVPWARQFLLERLACYGRAHHPLEARARDDLALYEHHEGPSGMDLLLSAGLH